MRALPAALVCLLALPFHPYWPDYEVARRGLLMVTAAAFAASARVWLSRRLHAADWALVALVAWHAIRSIGVDHPALGLQRTATLGSLWVIFAWAGTQPSARWLAAALPASCVVSVFGLAQAMGLPPLLTADGGWLQELATFARGDPVSTLGNRNYASEFSAVSAAAAVALVARNPRHRTAWITLALATAYLVVNQSRSGLLALPIATAFVLAQRGLGRRGRLLVLAALGAGLGAGLITHLLGSTTEDRGPATAESAIAAPSTVEIRMLLYQTGARMAAERPFAGHGAGQFAVHYPRFRTQDEIELQTWGRSTRETARTAHNDHLEILIDTGVPGLLAWWAFLILAMWRGRARGEALAPVIAFLAVSMVRSPLGNAPAAALAFACTGALVPRTPSPRTGWSVAIPLAGAGLAAAWLGVCLLCAQTVAAGYLRDRSSTDPQVDPDRVLDQAIAWNGADAALRSLRLQEHVLEAKRTRTPLRAADVDPDLDALAQLTPHDTHALLVRAEAAHRLGQPDRALGNLQQLFALDPRDPEAALLEATIHAERGRAAAAVVALYRDPHPRLLAALPQNFRALEQLARAQGRPEVEALTYRFEAAFLDAVEVLRRDPVSEEANLATVDFLEVVLEAGVDDIRPLLLRAIFAHAIDQPDAVAALGREVTKRGLSLARPHRRILRGLEQPLRATPAWRDVLRP